MSHIFSSRILIHHFVIFPQTGNITQNFVTYILVSLRKSGRKVYIGHRDGAFSISYQKEPSNLIALLSYVHITVAVQIQLII